MKSGRRSHLKGTFLLTDLEFIFYFAIGLIEIVVLGPFLVIVFFIKGVLDLVLPRSKNLLGKE